MTGFPPKRKLMQCLMAKIIPIEMVAGDNKFMNEILQYLKSHGEQLDAEIAAATGLSLADAHRRLSDLAANGQVVAYHSIKFDQGKKIEGIICRLTGFIPPAAPGRRSKAQLKLS